MIPKNLHYVVLGDSISPLCKECMKSWSKYFDDDWRQFKWTDEEIEFLDIPYVNNARQQGKFAFVSDVVRFYALHKYGGIYLDLDVEIISSFNGLLDNAGFIASESIGKFVPNAAIIGLEVGHPLAKDVLDFYYGQRGDVFYTIPYILKELFKKKKYDICVLPPESFYPYNPFDKYRKISQLMFNDIKKDTYAIHHWNQSWIEDEHATLLKRLGIKIRRYFLDSFHVN